jgi:di/tricarboxylate transporter
MEEIIATSLLVFPLVKAAAPSNALVFAAGNFKTHEMMKNGFFMNVLCIAVLFVNTITYGDYLFDFHGYEYVSENS